jgi:hypothetical protein
MAGRYRGGGRTTVEDTRSIDSNLFLRRGWLTPGWSGEITWSRDREVIATIRVRAEVDRIVLNYRVRSGGEDWQPVNENVRVERVPCRYGGVRAYFICPGVVNGVACKRRMVKLYGAGRYFLCRRCYCLAYECQNERPWDRIARRAHKIRRRLRNNEGWEIPPLRPKGMWRKTYERQLHRLFAAEEAADMSIMSRFPAWEGEWP